MTVPPLQAQRDSARYISFERKAALAEQAEALKRQIKESQLSSFRTEAKARWVADWQLWWGPSRHGWCKSPFSQAKSCLAASRLLLLVQWAHAIS